MKKRFIDLQLFAEEATTTDSAASAATEQGNPTVLNEPVPAATLKDKGELKYSDADVNKLIDQKFAEWQKKQQKAVDEAQKLATMNATQKAEYDRDQLQKELDELKRQASIAEMSKAARKMLADDGISITDDLLSMIVNTNAEETKAAVDSFGALFKEAVESAVKDRLRGEPPKKGSSVGAPMSEIDKRISKYQ